jgi:prepilin-type N-terminal cleavage/methylation domain-containing protein
LSTLAYWLDLFTGTTWKEFHDAGAVVLGFRHGIPKPSQLQSSDGDPQDARTAGTEHIRGKTGFTLIELLVVIAIIASPGRIGLWTKADAVTHFDQLMVKSYDLPSSGMRSP